MNVTLPIVLTFLGLLLTFIIFLIGVVFKTGHLSARVEELESWRKSTRTDMHEVSDKIEEINKNIVALTTLIEERTERRAFARPVEVLK